ncbi:MAG: type II secretion system GspH family protein [Candidatus Pacebacteria bacterium]|nr:type II secretion system GspH family protein [Candidatus Paceibacterota bacterium]
MKNKGFTIIELLVVVSIIGVIASIILTGLVDSRARARDAKLVSEVNQITKTLALYRTANNEYPQGSAVGATDYVNILEPLVTAGYYEAIPRPDTDHIYYYAPCDTPAICGEYTSDRGYAILFSTESLKLGLSQVGTYYIIGSTN